MLDNAQNQTRASAQFIALFKQIALCLNKAIFFISNTNNKNQHYKHIKLNKTSAFVEICSYPHFQQAVRV